MIRTVMRALISAAKRQMTTTREAETIPAPPEPEPAPVIVPARSVVDPSTSKWSQSTKYHIEVLESETCPDCKGAKLQGWYRCKACVATRINAGALR